MAGEFVIPARLPAPPERWSKEEEQKFRRILELALRQLTNPPTETRIIEKSTTVIETGGGVLPQRTVIRVPLALGTETELQGVVTFPTPPSASGIVILNVKSELDGLWFRLFAKQSDGDDDAARTVDEEPDFPIILDALFGGPDSMFDLAVFAGDARGELAFDMNDPAVNRLYYRANYARTAVDFYTDILLGTSAIHATFPDHAVETIDNWSAGNISTYGFSVTDYGEGYPNGFAQGRYVVGAEGEVFGHHPAIYGWAGVEVAPLRLTPLIFDPFDHSDLVGEISGWRADDAGGSSVHMCAYLNDGDDYDRTYLRMGIIRASSSTIKGHISWIDGSGIEHSLATGSPVTCLANSDPDPGHSGDTWDFKGVLGLVDGVQTARVYIKIGSTWTLEAEAAVPSDVQIAGHTYVGLESSGTSKAGYTFPYAGFPIERATFGKTSIPGYVDIGYLPIERSGGTMVIP